MAGLDSRTYFPVFDQLPLSEEYVDPQFYADVGGGTMVPTKHWAFFADIVDASLSHVRRRRRHHRRSTQPRYRGVQGLGACMIAGCIAARPHPRPRAHGMPCRWQTFSTVWRCGTCLAQGHQFCSTQMGA